MKFYKIHNESTFKIHDEYFLKYMMIVYKYKVNNILKHNEHFYVHDETI